MPGNRNAVKALPADLVKKIEDALTEGWSFKEIRLTYKVSHETLAKHWPGRGWTHRQIIEHAIAARQAKRAARRAGAKV